MKTNVIILATDPQGTMATINLTSEDAWIPLDTKDIKKMKKGPFRPSKVLRIEMKDEPYSYYHDSQFGAEIRAELREAGYAIVPKEPTVAMINAAQRAQHDHYWPDKKPTEHTWKVAPIMVTVKLWRAMVEKANG